MYSSLKGEIQFNRHSRGQKDMEDSDIESMRKQTAEMSSKIFELWFCLGIRTI